MENVRNEDLVKHKNRLLKFSEESRELYIYGAGNFGRGYFDILQHYGCNVNGFIVTQKNDETYLDRPVYSIKEISETIREEDGVIPAFTNSNLNEIKNKFSGCKPRVLDFNHKLMLCIENEIHFFPIVCELDNKFPAIKKTADKSEWNDILIVRLDAIGDAVFTTPFLRELRRNFKESHISIVIRRQNEKVFEHCPYIDKVYFYDSEWMDGELTDQCQNFLEISIEVQEFTKKNFSGQNFDVVFIPRELLCGRNGFVELVIAYYSQARYRIGRMLTDETDRKLIYERLKSSFTLISNPSKPMHEAAYALDMLQQCGCIVEDERMELWTGSQSESRVSFLFHMHRIEKFHTLIALGIVASVDVRTWKVANYNRIIRYYGENYGEHIRFIIMGGNDAESAAEQINESYGNVVNLAGKTDLNETAACMKKCRLYVGSNTGLLHFASAFGVPSVTIYSELSDGKPTDGDSPFRMGAWKVPHIDLIPPAGLDGCHGVCRMGFSHCINQITPGQVIDSINRILRFE